MLLQILVQLFYVLETYIDSLFHSGKTKISNESVKR